MMMAENDLYSLGYFSGNSPRSYVLVWVSIAMIKYHAQKQFEEEMAYFILHFQVTGYHEGKSGQELKAGTWKQELMQRP